VAQLSFAHPRTVHIYRAMSIQTALTRDFPELSHLMYILQYSPKYCSLYLQSSINNCSPKLSDTLRLASADNATCVYNVEGDYSAYSQPVLF